MEKSRTRSPEDSKSKIGWGILGITVGIAAVIGAALVIKNHGLSPSVHFDSKLIFSKKEIDASYYTTTAAQLIVAESSSELKATSNHGIINIPEHIRNLTGGKKPSAAKIATAHEHNFELGEYQTWVENYTRRRNCA